MSLFGGSDVSSATAQASLNSSGWNVGRGSANGGSISAFGLPWYAVASLAAVGVYWWAQARKKRGK